MKEPPQHHKTRRTSGKPYKGIGMEGFIARWYARVTLKDIAEFKSLAGRLSQLAGSGVPVLEIAPGPGYLSVELAKADSLSVTGLDISESFVRIAQEKARLEGVHVDFRRGNAAEMPFPDESFELIVCRAAFKNFSEPVRALSEMHRVLKPGGKAVIIDLRRDVSKEAVTQYVNGLQLNVFSAVMTKAIFTSTLIKRAYTIREMKEMIGRTPFGGCNVKEDGLGFEVWLERSASRSQVDKAD